MVISAIIFDFFGVVCSDHYWRYVRANRQKDSEFREYADEVNLGDMSWTQFVQKVAEKTNTSVRQVNAMYEAEQIDPRVVGLIHELKKQYKIGLLTNAHHEFIDNLLNKNHLADLFDSIIVSSRVGVVKPNPAIFEQALEDLGLEPAEVVYIDDLERHVSSARALGMPAIVYRDFDQCKADLFDILQRDHK
jgi:epoxide hydrolase-like predicted phosphatase